MNARLDDTTSAADPVVRGVLLVTLVITLVGMLVLIRAAVAGGGDGHVTVRIDNQGGLAVQIDALDPSGDRVGLGQAAPRNLTTFQEIPDVGSGWTLVASYGGREVHREALARSALAARNWTVIIPASATSPLERAEFQ
jgi:catechol 2,3-dioxygenase-like lactoylglutathione lyase family enzyme